jgi:hypothetical protein
VRAALWRLFNRQQEPEMADFTKADAAKLVKRVVPEFKDGKPAGTVEKAVSETEVLAFRVDEAANRITVVTTDGQKLTGLLKAGK